MSATEGPKQERMIFVPVVTAALTAGASLAGLLPRAGPLRALSVALMSKLFRFAPSPPSIRTQDLTALNLSLKSPDWQAYTVVMGQKGVGKSCLVDTATAHQCSVIDVTINHAMRVEEVVRMVLNELTGNELSCLNPEPSAHRVLFFSRLFRLPAPICILHVAERQTESEMADIVGAVRLLREKFKLRIVVDASPNSVPEQLLERQDVITVNPMSREMIEVLPQLQQLFPILRKANLMDEAWSVLGGIPTGWIRLATKVKRMSNEEAMIKEAGDFLCDAVHAASTVVHRYKEANPHMKAVLKEVVESPSLAIPSARRVELLKPSGNSAPSPDNLLFLQKRGKKYVFAPSTGAIAIVLKCNVTKRPNLEELREFVRKVNMSSGSVENY